MEIPVKIIKQIIIYTLLLILYAACGGSVDTPPGGTDTTPPTLTGSNPAPNSTVSSPSSILVSFNEPIDLATITPTSFVIEDSTSYTLTAADGSWGLYALSNTIIEFIPNNPLQNGTTTISITTAIADLSGNNLSAYPDWVFTISAGADTTPPTIIGSIPAANDTVSSPSSITVFFNEPINLATVTSASFVIEDSGSNIMTAADGSWGLHPLSNSIIEFIPTIPLPPGTTSITVTTALADLSGNNFAADQSWVFAIAPSGDVTSPIFLSGNPTGSVTTACSVTATFDEPIDSATVTSASFVILDSNSYTLTGADGIWALDPLSTAKIKFVPNNPLPIGTTDVTLTTTIADLAGNQATAQTWSFTTTLPCAP
jgi:hypothetical protein